jgi:transposase
MAPNLTRIQHDLLQGMLLETTISDAETAATVECSERSVRSAHSNLLHFGSTKAPSNGGGRPAKITPLMKAALREHLLEKPTLYQEDMVTFLEEKFGVQVARSSVGQVPDSIGWSKKKARHVA